MVVGMCAWFMAAGRVAEGARQSLAQLQARAQETHFHVGLGDSQGLGSLPDREILHVPEQKNGAVAGV
jgi:hypothetical protein